VPLRESVGCYEIAMGKLTDANPTARELVTEILDKALWWSTLKVIVQFLHAKNVEQVRVEFGFALDCDLEGKPQAQDQIVQLSDFGILHHKKSGRRKD
jgi:hypothetical protein